MKKLLSVVRFTMQDWCYPGFAIRCGNDVSGGVLARFMERRIGRPMEFPVGRPMGHPKTAQEVPKAAQGDLN